MPQNSLATTENARTTLIDQTFFNGEVGLVFGLHPDTEAISFDTLPNGTLNIGRAVAAFQP
jgi:hypothetical protein